MKLVDWGKEALVGIGVVISIAGIVAIEACDIGNPETVRPGVLVESHFVEGSVFRIKRWSKAHESWEAFEEGEDVLYYPTYILPREIKCIVTE